MAQDALEEYLNVVQGKEPLSTQQPQSQTNSSFRNYYNILQQDEKQEEEPSYSDALMLEYTNKIQKNPQALTLGKVYTLDELETNSEFQMRAERFMENIGRDEDIFEYLRDTDFSLSSAIARAGEVKGWSDEAKADYNYLRNVFDNAEIGSTRQYLELAGDMTVDLIADPINWLAAVFFVPSGGTSSLVGLSAKEAVKAGLKSATTKKLATVGAVEGSTWSGAHDYFLQNADVELGMRDEIDWSQVGMTSALGAGLGGVFGGSIGAVTSIAPALSKKIFKYSNEGDVIDAGKNVSRELEEESFGIDKAVDEKVKDKRLKKRTRWLSNTFGKYTTQFVEMSENSPALQQLLGRFRYDWARTFTQGAQGIEARSYGLELSERMHNYLFEIKDALQPLSRGSSWFKNTLRQDQNDNLIRLLRQNNKDFEADVASGKAAKVAGQEVVTAATKIRQTLNNIFEEGVENKLMTRDQFIDHYFPRHFQHSKIKANKPKFIEIIKNSKHSEIQNVYPESAYARDEKNKIITKTLEDGKTEKVLGPNAKWIDEEVFGKNFLTEAGGDMDLARQLKAEAIVKDMLEKRYNPFQFGTKNNAGGGHSFLQHRVFKDIDDNLLEDFLENDVEEVLKQYVIGASRAITRTKFFGKTKADFEKRWITPISTELRESGVDGDEILEVTRRLRLMHERVTGLDTDQIRLKGKFATNTLDTLKLTQQMAHLPFATLSSLTEPLILLSRVDSTSGKFAASKEVGKALVKGIKKDVDKFIHYVKRVSGKDVKGFADMQDEYWHEAYKVGLAMEQAVMDRIEGLTGEALEGSLAKRLQNAFFKANFLSSWTGAVQLASFTTGKRLIRENTEQLITGKTLFGNKLSQSKREYLTKQLHELGIDEKQAKKWYKTSLDKNGVFDEGRAMGTSSSLRKYEQKNQVAFYKNQYQHGANRFTREIILNPSTAEANRPLWFSHPAGQLLAQFAGYPTVFNNTVLKRWINEGVFEHKRQTTAKIAGTALAMTSIAVFTNAVRSGGRSLEEDEGTVILEAIQRWGGLGPLDYAYRFQQNATTGSGQAATLLKTPTGPIVSDIVDAAIYRKGLIQTLGTNVPFYSALPKDLRDSMKKSTKDIDKALWGSMFPQENKKTTTLPKRKSIPYTYAKGGIVNVPNASTEPDEKKVRGLPITYAELGGVLAQDVEDRRGFVFGGIVNQLVRYVSPTSRRALIDLTEDAMEDETLKHLTKEIRKAEPIFDANTTTSRYTKKEADNFAKGVDAEVVRYVNSDKVSEIEKELRYSTEIGAKATTKPKASGKKKIKHKGKLRLVKPLDLGRTSPEEIRGSRFVESLQVNKILRNNIISNSTLPKEDATRIVNELINNYKDTKNLITNVSKQPLEVTEPLLDIKQSIKLREALTDLGYDSIRYNETEYILFDNNQFRVTKKLKLNEKTTGLSTALSSTIKLGKQKRSKQLRQNYLNQDYLDTLKPKSKKASDLSKFNFSANEVYKLLLDGEITVPEARMYLRDAGYRKATINKLVRGFKDINYAKGDDFITWRKGLARGGEVEEEKKEDEEDSFKLIGKDGVLFDHTDPLSYALLIPGVGFAGWVGRAVGGFSKASKATGQIPKTVYHGGREFSEMKFGKLDHGVLTEGLHRPKVSNEISGLYTSTNPKYAAGYTERLRGLRTDKHGTLDHLKIDDPKVQKLRKEEVKKQIEEFGYPGFMKIDLSGLKSKEIHFWDKPTKKFRKTIDKKILQEKNNKLIDPLERNIRIGELRKLVDHKKLSIDTPKYFPDISPFQHSVLRDNGYRAMTKSTHLDNEALQAFAKRKGVPEEAEFILLDKFPVKALSPQEKDKTIEAYLKLMDSFFD